MSSGTLHIVAVGARTPVGLRAVSAAAAVRAGVSRVRRVEDQDGEHLICVDARLRATTAVERMQVLGCCALAEVVEQLARGDVRAPAPVPVIVGLPEARPGWAQAEQQQVLAALAAIGSRELPLAVEALPVGHAAALDALRSAAERIRAGQSSLAIVGGLDSYHAPETLLWLNQNRQWFGPDVRSGFVPGEGAAFVAVMRAADARRAGLEPLAAIETVASAREDKLLKSDELSLGEGLTAAVAQALRGRGAPVDDVYCDINGERYRSEEWGFVALRLAAGFRDTADYRTGVGCWGDVGAASGALNLVLATQAWRRGYAGGDRALVWGSSEGGLRSAALLEAPARAGTGGGLA